LKHSYSKQPFRLSKRDTTALEENVEAPSIQVNEGYRYYSNKEKKKILGK